jgi:polyhydroxyalkanoate synthesis regulator phasin
MLPEDYEQVYTNVEAPTTPPAKGDRQMAVDRAKQSLDNHDSKNVVQEQGEDGFPLLKTATPSAAVADTPTENEPPWDLERSYEEFEAFNAAWELHIAHPLEEEKQQQDLFDDAGDPFTSDPFNESWGHDITSSTHIAHNDEVDPPNRITPDRQEDWRELLPVESIKSPIPAEHKRSLQELDFALALEQGLSTSQDSTVTMTTLSSGASKPNMDEIMENAKIRRARLERAQNELAREPPTENAVLQKQDVQHLMKRIDKLSKYLQDEENGAAWETLSSAGTGLDSVDSSTEMHYHDIADATQALPGGRDIGSPSSPDRSLPPHIQPSVSCQATTLRPIFWMSYPKRTTQSPSPSSLGGQNNNDPKQEDERKCVIDNLPSFAPKMTVPTTSTASLVVLTPRRNIPGQSILRMPTVSPPTSEKQRLPPRNRSPAQQRIAVRAAVARLEETLGQDHSAVVTTNKTVTFPGVPMKATLFEGQGLDGISEDEGNECIRDVAGRRCSNGGNMN